MGEATEVASGSVVASTSVIADGNSSFALTSGGINKKRKSAQMKY